MGAADDLVGRSAKLELISSLDGADLTMKRFARKSTQNLQGGGIPAGHVCHMARGKLYGFVERMSILQAEAKPDGLFRKLGLKLT
ncbi:MAG: hypothetical protein ACK4F6_00110 [Hylemonella sp.]